MDPISRRRWLETIAAVPVAASLPASATPVVADQTATPPRRPRPRTPAAFKPAFFTAHEFATVTLLAELIIPADERSGGAKAARVPEFIDFMMTEQPEEQVAMRGGLAWLDAEMLRRFDKRFVDGIDADRRRVLDDIAWPAKAPAALSQGVQFFNRFRNMVATGFWTSRIGVEDLQYQGNKMLADWNGCPDAALKALGVSYD